MNRSLRLIRAFSVARIAVPRLWSDAFVAAVELALANRALRSTAARKLLLSPESKIALKEGWLSPRQQALVDRVARAIPAMGSRVPWRADCLIQAVAARGWLARAKIPSIVCIGVRKDSGNFEAHAWLKVGDQVVIGGNILSYAELPLDRLDDIRSRM